MFFLHTNNSSLVARMGGVNEILIVADMRQRTTRFGDSCLGSRWPSIGLKLSPVLVDGEKRVFLNAILLRSYNCRRFLRVDVIRKRRRADYARNMKRSQLWRMFGPRQWSQKTEQRQLETRSAVRGGQTAERGAHPHGLGDDNASGCLVNLVQCRPRTLHFREQGPRATETQMTRPEVSAEASLCYSRPVSCCFHCFTTCGLSFAARRSRDGTVTLTAMPVR